MHALLAFSAMHIAFLTDCPLVGSMAYEHRGIALKGALGELSTGKAILLSAVLFSALHSVNVLALMPAGDMVFQLGLTFVFGLAMACFALRVNSLVPLIDLVSVTVPGVGHIRGDV